MLKVGIVGLPNAGKSTLFNALITKPKAVVASHPFTTIDKNIGVVTVPDEILFQLAKIENIGKVTPATITFIDIAGLIKGAHKGEGLGNQFLHHIREVDLILHVVRFFKNESVPHVHTQIDPEEDVEIVNEELMLADLQSLEKRFKNEKLMPQEREILKKCIDTLNKGVPAVDLNLPDKEKDFIKTLNLLTSKKQLLVANIDEEDLPHPPKQVGDQPVLSICAKLEAEINDYPWVEQQKLLKDLGLKKTAKETVIKQSYHALDIITFYTIAKRREARAWVLKRGANAVDAAGKIHSDFARNFVKVEVIKAQELIKIGSWQKAHQFGKISLHGKDYLVQDEDVLEFKVALKSQ